jgi:hypothetical protein
LRILPAIILSLAFLSACKGGPQSKIEIGFKPVTQGSALAKIEVVSKAGADLASMDKQIKAEGTGDMSYAASDHPSVLTAAQLGYKNADIIALRAEGSYWCGTAGCNTDFYRKQQDGNYKNIGSVSFNLPAYALSCGSSNYILMPVPDSEDFAVWSVDTDEVSITDRRVPVGSAQPCKDL